MDEQFIIESIKSGCLQNIVKFNMPFVINNVLGKIIDIYNATSLKYSHNTLDTIVYRAMYNIPDGITELHHPIPFSTTKSLEFAREWLCRIDTGKVILKIPLHKVPHLCIEKDDECEITLPSGNIIIQSLDTIVDGIRYYTCQYIPTYIPA